MRRRAAALLAAVAIAIGFACSSGSAQHAETEPVTRTLTGHCGVERWAVKTGTDPAAALIRPAVVSRTVSQLGALPAPRTLRTRIAPTEFTTFRVSATLKQFKVEGDSDYHLVLTSGGKTLIAEIPSPSCVAGGSFAAAIASTRSSFDAKFGRAGITWRRVNKPVTITGVGFFDFKHGQTGAASNGIELHPVTGLTVP